MEFANRTPSKSNPAIVNKVLSACDSPFKFLPCVSTPPSRFTKILNPFESHLLERLHLPTFSPTVFAQVSTPKNDKFKWSIDDISCLKPADIDEGTLSQHVTNSDPHVESLVQEKIERFFNDKVMIAPSPMSEPVVQKPLISSLSPPRTPVPVSTCNNSAQTVLSLPPVLSAALEAALKPFFTFTEDQQGAESDIFNSSLHRQLFEFDSRAESVGSSPAVSTGLSPIRFSPNICGGSTRNFDSPHELPELRDCTLSPIGRSPKEPRSACRLSFSHMSIDASLVVPDVNQSLSFANLENVTPPSEEILPESSPNWDMEYKHVSILSRSPISSPELGESSNSNITPHLRIFSSQRKRLSDSFRDVDADIDMEEENKSVKRLKNRFRADSTTTDGGYHTGTICESGTWNASHMFASTPTKLRH